MRKYRLSLTHRHLRRLDEQIRDAILGNVGTTIAFRVGLSHAELLEKNLRLNCAPLDQPSNHDAYLQLMIDGVVSRPFSVRSSPHLTD